MKKRILSLLLALCLLCGMLPRLIPGTYAATIGDLSDSISWELDKSTGLLTITGSGPMPNWTDSGEASPWYDQRTSIRSLLVSSGITTIGSNAFKGCTYLSSVILPDGITTIGDSAFYACTLSSSFTLPSSVNTIGNYAFYGSRLTSLTIPSGVSAIGDYTFYGCNRLSSVEIPNSVKTIGTEAFYGCERLLSITIPNSVSSIGDHAFYGCTRLSSVTLPNSVSTIGVSAFQKCTALTSVTIPNKVEILSNSVFRNCTGLESVTIPESVTYIDRCAFYDCAALTSVTIPRSVKAIDYRAFYGCVGLESIYILNPACEFYDEKETLSLSENGRIYGYDNSTTEAFALKYGYTFNPLSSYPEPDESITIYHSLNLASDISINYLIKAKLLADYDSYSLEVIVPIYEGDLWTGYNTLTLSPVLNGNYYYFTLDGLTAIQMNDMVEATLTLQKDGVDYVSQTDFYSIATYAYSQLGKEGISTELKRICADLLRYGAKAQSFKSYRTDALADEAMTQEQKGYLTDLNTVTFNNFNASLDDIQDPVIVWVGKTLSLESKVVVRFIADTSAFTGDWKNVSLRVSYVDSEGSLVAGESREFSDVNHGDDQWVAFEFSDLRAADLRSLLSVAVYEGDIRISPTVQYSVDTYCNGKTGILGELCRAMIAYSDSAYAFFGN
ncbi:MAG: leucine-rich repeat domain-containing protein [Oscillospiraceae bacterium]|nr:leucine-rich repeat domain-containing protein [Oscillospiraceae bacterium]